MGFSERQNGEDRKKGCHDEILLIRSIPGKWPTTKDGRNFP
jgi:hypothetical protein